MFRRTVTVLAGAAALVVALGAAMAVAEEDLLVGVKVKDGTPPPNSTHAYTSSTAPGWAGNCTLKKPQFYLTRGEGDGGDNPFGGPAGEYVCYKATCDESPPDTYPAVEDARGSHTLEGKKVKLICLPAQQPVCGNDLIEVGEDCDGIDLGACMAGCAPDCSCAPPPPCPGAIVAGTCWVVGDLGDNCTQTCTLTGRAYDAATETYAGSGGTIANCAALMAALGGGSPAAASCSSGLGCTLGSGFLFLDKFCSSPATNAFAADANHARICGCEE